MAKAGALSNCLAAFANLLFWLIKSGGVDMPQGGGGIDTLATSEPKGQVPDFLDTPSGRIDAQGRRLAGGTTNLLLG